MSMSEWAKNEVKLACEKERCDASDNGEFNYGCACYESAMKAFQSLMDDGHSGMSINITKSILNRLIDGLPLTPIEDNDDMWSNVSDIDVNRISYQCNRMSSLFKYVYTDGSIKYRDIGRTVCVNLLNPDITYSWGFVDNIIDEMFPITMPYMPCINKYKVTVSEFLYDPNNGDFDTVGIRTALTPTHNLVDINRYFKEVDHQWVEIDEAEYKERRDNPLSE